MMHIFLCLTIVVLDQFTKWYMVGLLAVCERGKLSNDRSVANIQADGFI